MFRCSGIMRMVCRVTRPLDQYELYSIITVAAATQGRKNVFFVFIFGRKGGLIQPERTLGGKCDSKTSEEVTLKKNSEPMLSN